jgi:hypothetical protein
LLLCLSFAGWQDSSYYHNQGNSTGKWWQLLLIILHISVTDKEKIILKYVVSAGNGAIIIGNN